MQHFDLYKCPEIDTPFVEMDGVLQGVASVTNIGVFPYTQPDGTVLREARLPEHVFDSTSLASLKNIPVTNNHPCHLLTKEDTDKYKVGLTGESVNTDNMRVSVPLTITDPRTKRDVLSGKQGLSCGYSSDVVFKSGNFLGMEYDAIQTNIRYNHIAVVDRGRAGDTARIRLDSADSAIYIDSKESQNKMEDLDVADTNTLRTISLDNVDYQADEKVIAALQTAQKDAADKQARIDSLTTEKDSLVKEKSVLTAERDELKEKSDNKEKELAELKGKQMDDAQVQALVQKKLDEIETRKAVLDVASQIGVEAKDSDSLDDIRKAVVLKARPTVKLDDKDSVYIAARFDGVVEDLIASSTADSANRTLGGKFDAAGKGGDVTAEGASKVKQACANAYKNKKETK